MITKCKFCGGALKYDADIRRMVCEYCSSMFDVEDTEEEKEYENGYVALSLLKLQR